MTILDLWRRGVRNIRREPWSDGSYLELQPFPLDPTKYHIIALIHSPLEWGDVPDDVAHRAREVALWQVPTDGWEAYTGRVVEQRGAPTDHG
jgi:hypothetical protein